MRYTALFIALVLTACGGSPVNSNNHNPCGNGVIDPGETCDGTNVGAVTCELLDFSGGVVGCTDQCQLDTSGCTSCGNGHKEELEVCDAQDFGGQSCSDFGFTGGALACSLTCDEIDTSNCQNVPLTCGNGTADDDEACDSFDLRNQTCQSLGYNGGTLYCSLDCTYDTSSCWHTEPVCGNGYPEPGEQCDDGNTDGCDGCSPICRWESCGNGVFDCGEQCEDGNITGGDGCGPTCLFEVCGNGFVDAAIGEQCDDGNTVDGDGCSADCLSDETCGNGVVDAVTGETCDDGNLNNHDGCADVCLEESLMWTPLSIPQPLLRVDTAAEYFPPLQAIVLFGGMANNTTYFQDTWKFDGQWTDITPTPLPGQETSPEPRSAHALTYDAVRGVLVLIGGHNIDCSISPCVTINYTDVWEFDGTAWVQTMPQGSLPFTTAFITGTAAYDPTRQTVIAVGYVDSGATGDKYQTWEYDGTGWTKVIGAGTPQGGSTSYKTNWDRGDVWGTFSINSTLTFYEFGNGITWVPRAFPQDAYGEPLYTLENGMIVDHTGLGWLLIVNTSDDTIAYDGTWFETGASIPRMTASGIAYDPIQNWAVIFGGYQYDPWNPGAYNQNTWVFWYDL